MFFSLFFFPSLPTPFSSSPSFTFLALLPTHSPFPPPPTAASGYITTACPDNHFVPMTSPKFRSLAARPVMLSLAKLLFIALAQIPFTAAAPVFSPLFLSADAESPNEPSDPNLWLYLGISAALVLSGGAFAGLTIALMGQVSFQSQLMNFEHSH